MNTKFFDKQDLNNPLNGSLINKSDQLRNAFQEARSRAPHFIELIGENGFKLLVGIGGAEGCAQYSLSDDSPPYLMAVDHRERDGETNFMIENTATPVLLRYCHPYQVIEDIAEDFVTNGRRKSDVTWKEI